MIRNKALLKYTAEINGIAEEHLGALLALYADAFHEGMKAGRRNALLFTGLGIATATIWSCVAWLAYLDLDKQT